MSNTQKTTNLFQSVKSFINSKKPGERFTTRELTTAMNGIEYFTRWKLSNKNPFYRTHTYKAYLKRIGFIEMIKRGEWKVIANIPSWLDCGHINFVLFNQYPNRNMSSIREYKGETKEVIQSKITEAITNVKQSDNKCYQVGDLVEITSELGGTCNRVGDKGIITEIDGEFARVEVKSRHASGHFGLGNWSHLDYISLIEREHDTMRQIREEKVNDQICTTPAETPTIYIVADDSECVEFSEIDLTIHKDLESAKARYVELLKLKIEAQVYETKFGTNDKKRLALKLSQQDIKELASEIIGDGSDDNLWFVTQSAHVLVDTLFNGDFDYETLEGYEEDGNITTFGPFLSYKSACEAYDDIELDAEYGIGQVTIEDRQIGVVKEKFLRKQVVTKFVEDEHDDSRFYYNLKK